MPQTNFNRLGQPFSRYLRTHGTANIFYTGFDSLKGADRAHLCRFSPEAHERFIGHFKGRSQFGIHLAG